MSEYENWIELSVGVWNTLLQVSVLYWKHYFSKSFKVLAHFIWLHYVCIMRKHHAAGKSEFLMLPGG